MLESVTGPVPSVPADAAGADVQRAGVDRERGEAVGAGQANAARAGDRDGQLRR